MDARKIALCAIAVAILLSPSGQAIGQGYDLGMRSCGEFAKAYAANPAIAEDLYFTWAQGFISSLNLNSVPNTHVYRDINGDDIQAHKAHIRAYCDAHPLAQYVAAVLDLYGTFPPKREN